MLEALFCLLCDILQAISPSSFILTCNYPDAHGTQEEQKSIGSQTWSLSKYLFFIPSCWQLFFLSIPSSNMSWFYSYKWRGWVEVMPVVFFFFPWRTCSYIMLKMWYGKCSRKPSIELVMPFHLNVVVRSLSNINFEPQCSQIRTQCRV